MLSKRTRLHFLRAAGSHFSTRASTAAGRAYSAYLAQGGVMADEEAVGKADLPRIRTRLMQQLTTLRDQAAQGGECAEIIEAMHMDLTRLAKLLGTGRVDRAVMRRHARLVAARQPTSDQMAPARGSVRPELVLEGDQ